MYAFGRCPCRQLLSSIQISIHFILYHVHLIIIILSKPCMYFLSLKIIPLLQQSRKDAYCILFFFIIIFAFYISLRSVKSNSSNDSLIRS